MDSDDEFALPAPIGKHHQPHQNHRNAYPPPARARAALPAGNPVEMDMDEHGMADLGDIDDGTTKEHQIQQLMRHWMDERNAPELLHFKEELVQDIMQSLEAQTSSIELLTRNENRAKGSIDQEQIALVQLEIERVKYLLRAYLRIRTYKIETFSQYLLKTPAAKAKMSDVEIGYAERYRRLVEKHLTQSVIANLPERLGRLDEEEMIVKPDLDVAVFARALKACPEIILPDGQPLTMGKGGTHMLRYRSIRRLLRDGYVRLV